MFTPNTFKISQISSIFEDKVKEIVYPVHPVNMIKFKNTDNTDLVSFLSEQLFEGRNQLQVWRRSHVVKATCFIQKPFKTEERIENFRYF